MAHDPETKSTISSLPVADLIVRLQQASIKPEASIYCEELIRRFRPLIYKTWRHSGLEGDVADFVQEVLLRLFTHLHVLGDPKAFPGYFRRIILSVAADLARRQFRSPSLTPVEETKILDSLVVSLDDELMTAIFVRTYLEQLSGKERDVLTMEFLIGYQNAEIARQLEMSEASVRVVKSRALSKLRKLMLKDAEILEKSSA